MERSERRRSAIFRDSKKLNRGGNAYRSTVRKILRSHYYVALPVIRQLARKLESLLHHAHNSREFVFVTRLFELFRYLILGRSSETSTRLKLYSITIKFLKVKGIQRERTRMFSQEENDFKNFDILLNLLRLEKKL